MTTRTTAHVSSSSARRFARRQWSRRLLRITPLLVLLGLVVLAGVAVWVVAFSTLLDARTVAVRGLTSASGLSAAEVRAAAQVPTGEPLARVDLDAVRARLVAGLPPVEDATVERSWPHEVRIAVTERTAVAVWRDGDVRRLVDDHGVAFRTADGVPATYPLIELRAQGAAARTREPELRLAGAQVASALPETLARRVEVVEVRTVDAVVLRLGDGVTVMWGNADDSPAKAKVLQALLKQRADVYDVSVPAFPTTRG